MTRLLPALHEGHAPIHLHGAFSDALDAFHGWTAGEREPEVAFDGRFVRISSVFGRMRACTDILPWRVEADLTAVVGEEFASGDDQAATYADAARLLRALCVRRLRPREAA